MRKTVPENSLQSFLTIANPMPLLAPVTYKINNLNYNNYTGVDLHPGFHEDVMFGLERFSIECRNTKTKVINLTNHKGCTHYWS